MSTPATFRALAALVLLAAVPACRPAATAPPSPSPPPAESVVKAPQPPVQPPAAEPPATVVETPPPAVARWLLHSHRTAMLVETHAQLQRADAALQRLLATADDDGDGRTTWEELGRISNVFPREQSNDALPPDLMRTYDADGNDQVEPQELRKFLARGELVVEGWLAVQVDRRYERQLDSPTFRWLDEDNDGRLNVDEIEQAPRRLLEKDADDDGLVWPADLAPITPNLQPLPTLRTMSSANARRYVCAINEDTDWDELAFELEQKFSFGGSLTTGDLPRSCTLSRLDADGDGAITPEELARLQTLPPDLVVRVGWTPAEMQVGTDAPASRYAQTTLNGVAVELFLMESIALPPFEEVDSDDDSVVETTEFGQITGLNITFEAVDTDGNEVVDREEFQVAADVIQMTAEVFVNARVFRSDDPLFTILDLDKNARLDIREIEGAIEQLRPLLTEQESQLDPNALAASISIAFSNGLTNTNPISLPTSSDADGDRPGWFSAMDTDDNALISQREFLGTLAQFESLDADQDGYISVEEAAEVPPLTPAEDPI